MRTLSGHAHRVNTLALNCDYVLRTGAFQLGVPSQTDDGKQAICMYVCMYMCLYIDSYMIYCMYVCEQICRQ